MDQVQGVGNIAGGSAEVAESRRSTPQGLSMLPAMMTTQLRTRATEPGRSRGKLVRTGRMAPRGNQADDADPAHHDACAFRRLPFEGEHSDRAMIANS